MAFLNSFVSDDLKQLQSVFMSYMNFIVVFKLKDICVLYLNVYVIEHGCRQLVNICSFYNCFSVL